MPSMSQPFSAGGHQGGAPNFGHHHPNDEPGAVLAARIKKANAEANAIQDAEVAAMKAAQAEQYKIPVRPKFVGPPIPAICGKPGQFHSDGIVFTGHHRCHLGQIYGGHDRDASIANAKKLYPSHMHKTIDLAHAVHMMVRLTFVHADKVLMTITAFPVLEHEMCTKIKVAPNPAGSKGGVTLDMTECEVFKADPLFSKEFKKTGGIFHFPCVAPLERFAATAPVRISLHNLSPHLPPVTVEVPKPHPGTAPKVDVPQGSRRFKPKRKRHHAPEKEL